MLQVPNLSNFTAEVIKTASSPILDMAVRIALTHHEWWDGNGYPLGRKGEDIPESIRGTTRLSTMTSGAKKWPVQPAIKPFKKQGKCGTEFSEMLPNIGALADDICVVRSMNETAR